MTAQKLPVVSRCAFAALWAALGGQLAWLTLNATALHRHPGLDVIGATLLIVSIAFAALHGRSRWAIVAMRVVMAADFLLAVADRFGLLGAPGHPGVQWGNFAHFLSYTRTVMNFLPAELAQPAAIGATIAEIILGTALLLGIQTRLAAAGAASLLAIYATAMTIALPVAQQFHYDVVVLCFTMIALATLEPPTRASRLPSLRRLRRMACSSASP